MIKYKLQQRVAERILEYYIAKVKKEKKLHYVLSF